MTSKDDNVYARCFKNRPEGHAFYKHISAKDLKPGTCGYFDHQGDWRKIIQVTDKETQKVFGISPVQNVKVTTDSGIERWGAVVSEGARGQTMNVDVGATNPSGLPVTGGLHMVYESITEETAILLTRGRIVHNQATLSQPFIEWMERNAQAVIDCWDDKKVVEKKGIWIVTKTYTAKQRAIAVLRGKGSSAEFGIDVGAYGATVSPSLGWWKSQKSSIWKDAKDEDGIVLFMSGIWWQPRWYSAKLKAIQDDKKQRFLTGSLRLNPVDVQVKRVEDSDSDYIQLFSYVVGEDKQIDGLPRSKNYPIDDSDKIEAEDDDENFDNGESDVEDEEIEYE